MPNPIVHFEIGCRNTPETVRFYEQIFDWKMEEKGPVTMIRTGSDVGGHINALGHEPYKYTIFYVAVDDLAATLEKVNSLGGKTLVPPMEIPDDGGSFAWFADPEGNVIGIYRNPQG